jgi:hypothetical protein
VDLLGRVPLGLAAQELMTTFPARILHVGIDREWRAVADFVMDPANMPRWAAGLGSGLTRDGDDWIADGGPIGQVRVRFTPPNDLGVADHVVTMESGLIVHNALRVTPNGDGAEVAFVLLHRPDMDAAAFEADAAHVESDLATLKAVLEGGL